MALVVNLPLGRHYWPNVEPFLFLRPDGQYESYDPAKHPRVSEWRANHGLETDLRTRSLDSRAVPAQPSR